MGQGRIAREIAVIRELDDVGKLNYRHAMSQGMSDYADRYSDVNKRMVDALGVNLTSDLVKYPSQLKIVEDRPSTKGLAWEDSINAITSDGRRTAPHVWVRGDLPYRDKVLNHELAHVGFKHSASDLPVGLQEIQAEGTSYGVGHRLGIPVDVLAMSSAPTLNSRMKQYSPDEIGNMLEMNRSPIAEMVRRFMGG